MLAFSGATLGLAGVMLGAVVTAATVLLAERARRRSEDRRELRAYRREVYVRFLGQVTSVMYEATTLEARRGWRKDHPLLALLATPADRTLLQERARGLTDRVAELQLVAGDPLAQVARDMMEFLQQSLSRFGEGHPLPTADEYRALRHRYLAAARAELGLPEPAPVAMPTP